MATIIKLFPFIASGSRGNELFRKYVTKHKEELRQKYGHMSYIGKGDNRRVWSYFEVDVEVLDLHTVNFHTYSMLNPVHGGRGEKQEIIPVTYEGIDLYLIIEEEKIRIARTEFRRREAEKEQRRIEEGSLSVYNELFPTEALI